MATPSPRVIAGQEAYEDFANAVIQSTCQGCKTYTHFNHSCSIQLWRKHPTCMPSEFSALSSVDRRQPYWPAAHVVLSPVLVSPRHQSGTEAERAHLGIIERLLDVCAGQSHLQRIAEHRSRRLRAALGAAATAVAPSAAAVVLLAGRDVIGGDEGQVEHGGVAGAVLVHVRRCYAVRLPRMAKHEMPISFCRMILCAFTGRAREANQCL